MVKYATVDTVAAHEIGHYFGLKHPHDGGYGNRPHIFANPRVLNQVRNQTGRELDAILQTYLGEDYNRPYEEPFLPYNASAESLDDYEALRIALMSTWVRQDFVFSNNFAAFESFGAFMTALVDRVDMNMRRCAHTHGASLYAHAHAQGS